MRLTSEQRIAALEREHIVLQDTIKLLHRMLKEQRQLINDYITHKVSSSDEGNQQGKNGRSEDALYTFVCKQRFDYLERRMERMRKSFIDSQTSNAS
jgi:uncharacterized coiled-coil protein SlyX